LRSKIRASEDFAQVLQKMVDPLWEERWQDAQKLVRELGTLAAGDTRAKRLKRRGYNLAGALLLLLSGVAGYLSQQRFSPPEQTPLPKYLPKPQTPPAREPQASAHIRQAAAPAALAVLEFDDIEKAFQGVLGAGATASGQLAMADVEGMRLYFMHGRPVNLGLAAYRRQDGEIALVRREWTARLLGAGRSRNIPAPNPVPTAQPTLAYLDSKGRLWVGTWGAGLQLYDSARVVYDG
jgi:hypothetical protein